MQRNMLETVKVITGIIAMAEMLSMVLVIGSSDVGLIDTGTLITQLTWAKHDCSMCRMYLADSKTS